MIKEITRLLKTSIFFEPVLALVDLILFAVDLISCIQSRTIKPKTICIVKVDKLGDYIVFRNFIEAVRLSDLYGTYKITLLLSIELKPFAEILDKSSTDEILYIDIYKYSTNLFYRYRISRMLYEKGFEVSLSSTYSRVLVLDDFISYAICAKSRIGSVAHPINIKRWEKYWGDRLYTKLINTGSDVKFEYIRNRSFFENFLNADLKNIKLEIDVIQIQNSIPKNYVLVIPGAGDKFRMWHTENFAKLIDLISLDNNYDFVLCGSLSEKHLGAKIISYSKSNHRIINLIGIVSISEMLDYYANSKLIISNETGSVHLAAALNSKLICISNGNHFLRWTEYPDELGKQIFYKYPDQIEANKADKDFLAKQFDIKSNLDIDTILAEEVYKKVSEILRP